jgi:hypothetical protein
LIKEKEHVQSILKHHKELPQQDAPYISRQIKITSLVPIMMLVLNVSCASTLYVPLPLVYPTYVKVHLRLPSIAHLAMVNYIQFVIIFLEMIVIFYANASNTNMTIGYRHLSTCIKFGHKTSQVCLVPQPSLSFYLIA